MGRVAAIVQARVGSTRLPGKVLADVGGRTVLSHVLARCLRIPGVDTVVCAIPASEQNDQVAAEAAHCGVVVVRGAEDNVLERYRVAANAVDADVVIRITSDNMLVDPHLCGRVVGLLHDACTDYACNNMPQSWPHGSDCEVFSRRALEASARKPLTAYDREHVTPVLRTDVAFLRANLPCPNPALRAHRWTLDHPEDLLFLRALAQVAGPSLVTMTMTEILDVLTKHPDLPALNAQAPA